MTREIEGTITCPHCGNPEATVHRQAKGKRSLYYRCYTAQGGAEMRCGTVQIHGPAGQAFIERNRHRPQAEPANDPKAPEPTPTPAREAANDPKAPEPARQRRASMLGRFMDSLTQEEDDA